jgi:hypothetical protein
MKWYEIHCVCLFFKLCEIYVLLSIGELHKLLVYQFQCGVIAVSIALIRTYPSLLITNIWYFPKLFKYFPFLAFLTTVILSSIFPLCVRSI